MSHAITQAEHTDLLTIRDKREEAMKADCLHWVAVKVCAFMEPRLSLAQYYRICRRVDAGKRA